MGWSLIAQHFGVGNTAYAMIAAVIPIIITGGFHIDGFMDTADAIHSYKSRKEKLEIMKDPHIGAFSVIMLLMVGGIYIATISEINVQCVSAYAGAFFVARCLSGIAVILFPSAKDEGMLHTFSNSVKGKSDRLVLGMLSIQLLIGVVYMIFMSPVAGGMMSVAVTVFFIYYRYKMKSEFGGITGDTAGWFVTLAETIMAVAACVALQCHNL